MGYSSPSVIALVHDFTFIHNFFSFHPVTYGGEMIAFVSESTHLVSVWILKLLLLVYKNNITQKCFAI